MSPRKLRPPKALEDWALAGGLKVLVALFRLLPLGIGRLLAAFLARLAYIVLPRERRKTLAHLDVAFPHFRWSRKRRLAKRCYVNLAYSLVEFIKQDFIFSKFDDYARMEGLDELRRTTDEGRGAIVVSAHMGNWEMLAAATARSGLPVTVVAREIEPRKINRMLIEHRERSGVKSVFRDSSNAGREVLKAIRSGEIIGILIDQDTKKAAGDFVPFFGHQAYTPTGAAALARITGAPVFIGLSWRENGKLVFHFEPVDTQQFAELEGSEFDRALTAHLTAKIEEFIKAHPDQWVWMHERWRHRPSGKRWEPYKELPGASYFALTRALELIEDAFGKRGVERAERIGAGLGRLLMRLLGSRRRIAEDNIRQAFGNMSDEDVKRIVKGTFEGFGMNIALYAAAGCRPDGVFDHLEVEGWENLQRLLDEGVGVLGVGAHLGAWELGSWWLAERVPVSVVVKRIKNRAVEREAERIRAQFGVRTLYERGSALQIFRRLKRGEVVIMVLDQHAPSRLGVWVDFFGRPASTLKSVAEIASKTRSPLVVGYALREGAGRYRLVFSHTFDPPKPDEEAIKAATQQYTRAIEQIVRAHPDQWFWLHRRWKERPPGS